MILKLTNAFACFLIAILLIMQVDIDGEALIIGYLGIRACVFLLVGLSVINILLIGASVRRDVLNEKKWHGY